MRSEFWDALAASHAAAEDSFLNVSATRRIMNDLRAPVLVVGAGHGLIVAEIRKAGLRCADLIVASGKGRDLIASGRIRFRIANRAGIGVDDGHRGRLYPTTGRIRNSPGEDRRSLRGGCIHA